MKTCWKMLAMIAASAWLLSGCDQLDGGGSSSVAILDLAAVAKATGQDEAIREQAEQARGELTAQLQQLAANLEQQLAAEREKFGETPSAEDAQRLQELTQQARQQIGNAQQQAQNQASMIESGLVEEFRASVEPLAEEIAKKQGAKIVMAADAYVFWFDPSTDITDEVIAAWRAKPVAQESADEAAVEEALEDIAEAQSELEAAEQELAEAEEEIAELESEIAEGENPAVQ